MEKFKVGNAFLHIMYKGKNPKSEKPGKIKYIKEIFNFLIAEGAIKKSKHK